MGQSVTRTPSTVPVTMIKAQLAAAPAKVAVVASKAADAAKFAGVAAASLAVSFQASAVTIKMCADNGGLVFEPSSVSVKAGETITFVNNAGFPHNVVFDEDAARWRERRQDLPRGLLQRPRGDVRAQARQGRLVRLLLRAPPGRWHDGQDHRQLITLTT